MSIHLYLNSMFALLSRHFDFPTLLYNFLFSFLCIPRSTCAHNLMLHPSIPSSFHIFPFRLCYISTHALSLQHFRSLSTFLSYQTPRLYIRLVSRPIPSHYPHHPLIMSSLTFLFLLFILPLSLSLPSPPSESTEYFPIPFVSARQGFFLCRSVNTPGGACSRQNLRRASRCACWAARSVSARRGTRRQQRRGDAINACRRQGVTGTGKDCLDAGFGRRVGRNGRIRFLKARFSAVYWSTLRRCEGCM